MEEINHSNALWLKARQGRHCFAATTLKFHDTMSVVAHADGNTPIVPYGGLVKCPDCVAAPDAVKFSAD